MGAPNPSPDKFYKGGSQEKTRLRRPEFFLLPSPSDRARFVLTCRAIDSACGPLCPSGWGFFYQRFSSPIATKPSVLKPAKQERWSGANHGSIGDSWPIAFSGCPRGPRVDCETRCPKHTAPNLSAETRSRTRVSREPDGHRQRRSPGMERTRSETLKLLVVSDSGRRNELLSSRPAK